MTDPLIARLITRLSHTDYGTRRRATDDLVALGEEAVPALLEAVEGRSQLACVRAIAALGRIGSADAIPTLQTLLETERDETILMETAGALHQIRTVHADSPQARTGVREALAAYDRRVEKANQNSRMTVLPLDSHVLLTRFQEQQRLAALAKPLPSSSGTLQQSIPTDLPALIRLLNTPDYATGKAVIEQLVQLGEPAVEPLLTAELPLLARQRAAKALGRIGDPRAVPFLLQELQAALASESFDLLGSLQEALLELAKCLAELPTPAKLLPLILLTQGLRGTVPIAAIAAARGLLTLAQTHPMPELRQALPVLKGSFFQPVPREFHAIRHAIEQATAPWKDLPLTAAAPKDSQDLPLPSTNTTE